ncbi:MAG: M23 family metallopeptidase [Vicinamibacteria bacterium]|nr:M23 family metallopeptidase [Vicinamibacteria bacterium]
MNTEYYTLIVIPHTKGRYHRIQIPVRTAKWICGSLIAIVEVRNLNHLRAENQALLTKTKEYELGASALRSKVTHLEGIVTKLGVMAGLVQVLPDAKLGGVGGVSNAEAISPTANFAQSLREMDRNINDLSAQSAKLQDFYKDQKVLLSSTPSIWPVRGYLSAGFGNRIDPFTGQRDFHPGIDISTPLGTKVQAPADGVVVFVGPKGGYGNAIVIDHGYGMNTRFAHLDNFNVKLGQRVKRGDVIGFVGNTGRSTAPHLHYEVWVNNQTQNPIYYILDEYRSFG